MQSKLCLTISPKIESFVTLPKLGDLSTVRFALNAEFSKLTRAVQCLGAVWRGYFYIEEWTGLYLEFSVRELNWACKRQVHATEENFITFDVVNIDPNKNFLLRLIVSCGH